MVEFDAGQFAADYSKPEGKKLWHVLGRNDVVARMETASDLGMPALAAVEDILLGELGALILQDRMKQMAGRMVRQIMEAQGYEHETGDVRLNSVPFYKASRYRRTDEMGLYLFKNTVDPRDVCLTDTRGGEKMPKLVRGRWSFVNYITSSLKAQIGYGIHLKAAVKEVRRVGFLRHQISRVVKSTKG